MNVFVGIGSLELIWFVYVHEYAVFDGDWNISKEWSELKNVVKIWKIHGGVSGLRWTVNKDKDHMLIWSAYHMTICLV